MPQLDLSTYEGRQAARDQGYWVGDDGSGSIVAEYQGAPSGGGGGGGGSPQPAQQTGGSPAPAGGGGAVYQTKNGPRTVQQMEAELYAVGWGGPVGGTGGPGAIANAYARTTGGPVTEMAGQNYGAAAQNQMLPVNPQTGQQMDEATAEAYRRYLQWLSQSGADQYQLQLDRLGLERDRLSLDREKAATDMQLARNADARAEAMLRIQQADQALRENQFKQQQLEFEKTLTQRQTEFRQTQYSDLAKTLLQGAASLRGPRDWMQYAEFTGGGRNLYDQLYGSEGTPAFGGERGPSPAINVGDVMNSLGFIGGNPPTSQAPQNVPLPHQINPASWDTMAPAARQLTLGLAEKGFTGRGVYTPEDYERIINASRPVGTATRQTRSLYGAPQGVI
jgi:hypothetical protein